jgi:hypothetical protein
MRKTGWTVVGLVLCAPLTMAMAASGPLARAPFSGLKLVPTFEADSATVVSLVPGAVVMRTQAQPGHAAVVAETTQTRSGGVPQSYAAGTPLVGVTIDNGVAFCGLIDAGKSGMHTQCLRDIDANGTFEASYLVRDARTVGPYFVGRLYKIAGMRPVPYTVGAGTALPGLSLSLVYQGQADGRHQFDLRVGEQTFDRLTCPQLATVEAPCALAGGAFAIEAVDGVAKLKLVGPAPEMSAVLPAPGANPVVRPRRS